MAHYILQIIAFQLLFLVVYDLFLKKELYFNWNRAYLILTPILSFVLPLIKIDFIRQNIPSEYIFQLPTVFLGANTSTEIAAINLDEAIVFGTSSFSMQFFIQVIWGIGMLLSLGLFLFKLNRLNNLKHFGSSTKINNTTIVCLPKTDQSFSFLNTIFLGENLSEEQKETILLHEKIHVQEKHSIDLLFFEALKIICWFNPLVYIFQTKMTLLQEFIADKKVASVKGKKEYYQGLLSQVFKTENISFINTFFNHSLIKKRITMLQKSKSNQIAKFKYLLLLPVIAMMLVYTSCTKETNAQAQSSQVFKSTSKSNSDIIKNIEALKESIAVKGNITKEEESALKALIVLFDGNNLENHYYDEVKNLIELPFGTIQKVPTYPGCTGTNEELKKCMASRISAFVNSNFNIKLANKLGLTGRQRITVLFKIDLSGQVVDIRARAAHPDLVTEAERIVSLLPKMKPGEQDGKQVGVLYTLPIIFEIVE